MLYFKLLILSMILYATLLQAYEGYSVVVSSESSIQSISKEELSRIFLSKTKRLPNNEKALTIELKDTQYQKYFYKSICGKNLKQLKRYWATIIFTGKGQPPKKMQDFQDLFKIITENVNAISYIPKSTTIPNGIKIIYEEE
ncbi:MAG: hypothetical protein ACJAWW_001381 [Sulfurimonas sp.]|jgi:hypothetical protein